jgi:hypothetical protein
MRQDTEPQLQALLKNGPSWLDGWLRQVEEGTARPGGQMNGISEGAAHLAKEQSSLEWADISIRAANLWAQTDAGARENALHRSMLLRVWFIARMGASSGHPVLDKAIILDWFVRELEVSIEVAKERIGEWQAPGSPLKERLPLDEVRELRRIKNRLGIVQLLAEAGELPSNSPACAWLEIRSQLP